MLKGKPHAWRKCISHPDPHPPGGLGKDSGRTRGTDSHPLNSRLMAFGSARLGSGLCAVCGECTGRARIVAQRSRHCVTAPPTAPVGERGGAVYSTSVPDPVPGLFRFQARNVPGYSGTGQGRPGQARAGGVPLE
jgi:hypothetical protein